MEVEISPWAHRAHRHHRRRVAPTPPTTGKTDEYVGEMSYFHLDDAHIMFQGRQSVAPKYRRRRVATALLRYMNHHHPTKRINPAPQRRRTGVHGSHPGERAGQGFHQRRAEHPPQTPGMPPELPARRRTQQNLGVGHACRAVGIRVYSPKIRDEALVRKFVSLNSPGYVAISIQQGATPVDSRRGHPVARRGSTTC